MKIKNSELCAQAQALRGCLSHLGALTGRRRFVGFDSQDIFQLPNYFVGDEAKILSSKAFRNTAYKTQVTTDPTNTFIRSRMTHILEIVSCSVVTSELLRLNTSLARAIALGHDIGHVPLGHQGEAFIAKAMGQPKFCHEVMAPIVAQKIERKGQGLNLTYETLEGMMCHSGNTAKQGMTPEAWIVRYADKFAYIFHDFNDFRRMGYSVPSELQVLMEGFGSNQRERTNTAIASLVIESSDSGKVRFQDSSFAIAFGQIRTLMYEVYEIANKSNPDHLLAPVLDFLIGLDRGNPFLLLALMTDKDIVYLASQSKIDMEHFQQTAIFEMLPYLETVVGLDMYDACLNW